MTAPAPEVAPAESATQPCPSCGAACKPGAKFCGKCGHAFAAAPAPAELPVEAAVEPVVEPVKAPITAAAPEMPPAPSAPPVPPAPQPFTGDAPPASHEVNGRQYIVVSVSGGDVLGTPQRRNVCGIRIAEELRTNPPYERHRAS